MNPPLAMSGKDHATVGPFVWHRDWSRRLPAKIAILYAVLAVSWCLFEHKVLGGSPLGKDLAFTFVIALLMYWAVGRGVSAIRESEKALRESEERLARVVETNISGILVVDMNGKVTFANSEAAVILGIGRGELIGADYRMFPLELFTANGKPFPADELPFERVIRTGGPVYGVEIAVRRHDGKTVILSANAAPFQDPDGRMVGMVSSFSDITESRQAEQLAHLKLFLAVEQSSTGIAITDPEGRIEYVNPRFTTMTGYTPGELVDAKMPCPTETSPDACRQICGAFAAGVEWRGEFENRRKNGERCWESAAITPIRNAQGAITNFLCMREDITEHRVADEAMRESEERFRQLFEQNEEPLILFKPGTSDILDANPAAVALYGYGRDELTGKGPPLFVAPADLAEFGEKIRAVGAQKGFSIDRANHLKKDGTPIIVSVRLQSIRLRGGEVSYCSVRDITERIRMEEEAKAHQAQLIHANRMTSLGMIVAGVAHEINNPNNLIMFNAPMIASAWRDAEPVLSRALRAEGDFSLGGLPYSEMREVIPKLLEGIKDASSRIKGIVGALKDYARRDRSARNPAVDVNEVVSNALSIIRHEILRGTHLFGLDLADDLPRVSGSSQQLEQVLMNLVINALHALPDNRCGIRVSTSPGETPGRVEIRVEDEGTGIPPGVMARITEPFHTTKHENGGMGLGLSISNSIVKEHGGTMVFETQVGKGTRVRVILPAAGTGGNGGEKTDFPHPAHEPPHAPPPRSAASGAGKRREPAWNRAER